MVQSFTRCAHLTSSPVCLSPSVQTLTISHVGHVITHPPGFLHRSRLSYFYPHSEVKINSLKLKLYPFTPQLKNLPDKTQLSSIVCKPSWTCLGLLPSHSCPLSLPLPTHIPPQPPWTPGKVSPVPALSTALPQPVHCGANFYFSGPTTSFSVLPIAPAKMYLVPLFDLTENPVEKANKWRQ